MKKNMFNFVASLLVGSLGFITSTVYAAETTINDGSNTGDVTINGTLGADNKDPDAKIPEGSDSWINVTLDTATIFYNTSSSTTIESPKYTIKNNSGRPVKVTPTSITQTNSVDISSIKDLTVNFKRDDSSQNSSAKLVSEGSVAVTQATTLTLANKVGQLLSTDTAATDTSTVDNASATFSYGGSVSSALSTSITPTFTMTLTFAPIIW